MNSRRTEIEAFVGTAMADMPEWRGCQYFAPAVRTSVALVRLPSQDEVYEFIKQWKEMAPVFKTHLIRARADKTPQQRKANAKLYAMAIHMRTLVANGMVVDPDWKHGKVWVEDWPVVQWRQDPERWEWNMEAMTGARLDPTKTAEYEQAAGGL